MASEAEASNEVDSAIEQADTPKHNKPKRKPLPKDLPREVVELDLSDSEKVCECCQSALHRIGEDRSERLEFTPAKMTVIETIRPKYGCRHCEQNETEVTIKQAPQPLALSQKALPLPAC